MLRLEAEQRGIDFLTNEFRCAACLVSPSLLEVRSTNAKAGGARRDRTDDLLLAKQALSQLSYGPFRDQASVARYQEQCAS